jgi:alpha-ketoglutarate-dependent taurine dioxygenase
VDRSLDALTPQIGTEVLGVDLANLSPGDVHAIRRLLKERLVLVFRDQHLGREQHKALGRHFGTGALRRYRPEQRAGNDPEVRQVKAAGSRLSSSVLWRAEASAHPNPVSTSLLYLMEPPQDGGGDIVFANMYLAYETLSEPIKVLIGKLSAVHDEPRQPWDSGGDGHRWEAGTAQHPVVIRHPDTGNKLLWVNRLSTTRLLGLSAIESRHLLEALLAHAESNPALQCRVRWRAHTMVMWDNLAAQYFPCWDCFPTALYGEWVSSQGRALEAAY